MKEIKTRISWLMQLMLVCNLNKSLFGTGVIYLCINVFPLDTYKGMFNLQCGGKRNMERL